MVLVNSGFHTRKNVSEIYPKLWHASAKMFASPVLGRKSLKNIGLKGRQIISLPGKLTRLGPALDTALTFDLTYDDTKTDLKTLAAVTNA
jgi:hypothetical protein